jgi:hypothetical protein
MTANAADFGSAALSALLRALGVAALIVGAGLALVFAFAAALVVGLLVTGAAIALRFMPRRRAPDGETDVLNARKTPFGWVVETPPR